MEHGKGKRKYESITPDDEGTSTSSVVLPEDDGENMELLDVLGLKKMILSLEKKINKNIQLRNKYPTEPEKFMDSEVDLDEELKKIQVLAAQPELYPDFAKLGAVQSLLSLFAHENNDIVADVIDLLFEMTEPDTLTENPEAMVLVDELLNNQIAENIVQNLPRFKEEDEEEQKAIHNSLGILENLAEVKPITCEIAADNTPIIDWLLDRLKKPDFNAIKLYASEILAIYLQSSDKIKKKFSEPRTAKEGDEGKTTQAPRLEDLLLAIAVYRTKTPSSMEETEVVENLFDCVCYALMIPENQTIFRRLEGIELCLLMIKKNKYARHAGIKTIDYALMRNVRSCQRFVSAKGLKTLFAVFMKPVSKKRSTEETEDEEHIISCITNLLNLLSAVTEGCEGPSTDVKRIIAKFKENDFEKTDRLMELYGKYRAKVEEFDRRVESGEIQRILQVDEDEEVDEQTIFLEKLDAGYFVLQQICVILGYISADSSINQRILVHLKQHGWDKSSIKNVLIDYSKSLGDKDVDSEQQQQEAETSSAAASSSSSAPASSSSSSTEAPAAEATPAPPTTKAADTAASVDDVAHMRKRILAIAEHF